MPQNDDDVEASARVSAMWWSRDCGVVEAVADVAAAKIIERGSWRAVCVGSVTIVEDDAAARQAALEAFLFEVGTTLIGTRPQDGADGLVGLGELRVHIAVSGPEPARGIVLDPHSIARLLPFGLAIFID